MSKKHDEIKQFIFVCKDKDCKKKGAKELLKAFEKSVKKLGFNKNTKVLECYCTGRCKEAPIAIVNNQWKAKVDLDKVDEITEESLDTPT